MRARRHGRRPLRVGLRRRRMARARIRRVLGPRATRGWEGCFIGIIAMRPTGHLRRVSFRRGVWRLTITPAVPRR
jgi:hypothetical protein